MEPPKTQTSQEWMKWEEMWQRRQPWEISTIYTVKFAIRHCCTPLKFCNKEDRTGQRHSDFLYSPHWPQHSQYYSLNLRTEITGICHHLTLERLSDKYLHLISSQLAMAVFTLRELFLCMVTPQRERQRGRPEALILWNPESSRLKPERHCTGTHLRIQSEGSSASSHATGTEA